MSTQSFEVILSANDGHPVKRVHYATEVNHDKTEFKQTKQKTTRKQYSKEFKDEALAERLGGADGSQGIGPKRIAALSIVTDQLMDHQCFLRLNKAERIAVPKLNQRVRKISGNIWSLILGIQEKSLDKTRINGRNGPEYAPMIRGQKTLKQLAVA